jgi:tetratricopeptide (TPR) repeat protein
MKKWLLLSVFLFPGFINPAWGQTTDAELSSMLEAGQWDTVIERGQNQRDASSVILVAEAQMWRGLWSEAEEGLRAGLRREPDNVEMQLALSQVLLRRGSMQAAVELLDSIVEGAGPVPLRARYLRGVAYDNIGRTSRAALDYGDLVAAFNRNEATTAEDLMYVGMACHRLALYSDANFAFQRALEREPEHIDTRLRWAELFFEKYRPDEALRLADEVLERNPSHPLALVHRARAAVDTAYDVHEARVLLDRALLVDAGFPEALELKTEIALDSRDFPVAMAALDLVDARVPDRLETLTLRGAVYLLQDDEEALEEVQRRVLRIRPDYARFFHQLGEVGVRNFRYVESMDWFQQALDVDAGYWPAFVSLGIGWSRLGDDERALQFLRRAFDSDPFNLQAFHMVELFEGALQDYRVVPDPDIPAVQYRFHESEQSILEQYVPRITAAAWHRFVEWYGIVPEAPVSIEIFPDGASFGIRSVGLPHVSPHGICFGHLVTSRSPSEGNFNWQLVLEHELSHVFALNASRYRMPRWFAEGLAEYDTSLVQEHWRRDEQIAMVQSLQNHRLVPVEALDEAFTSVDNIGQVLAAYYQAFLLVEYIATTRGRDSLMQLLTAFADSQTTGDAIRSVLGCEPSALDEEFEAWMSLQLGPMLSLYEPDLTTYSDVEQFESLASDAPSDAQRLSEYGVSLVVNGEVEAGLAQLERALGFDPRQPLALYVTGLAARESGQSAAAIQAFSRLNDAGLTSYSGLVEWGRALRESGRASEAREVLRQAASVFPRGSEARVELAELAEAQGDGPLARALWTEISQLDENDAGAAERATRAILGSEGSPEEALVFASRFLQIALFDPDAHGLVGRAAMRVQDWQLAIRELQTELEMGAENRRETLQLLMESYERAGDVDAAEAVRRQLSP